MIEIMQHMARAAGGLLISRFQTVQTQPKGTHDVVTSADLASETLLKTFINVYFPDHNVLAEETGTHDQGSDYTWVIDPLDGTRNYVLGIPYFSVSIALMKRQQVEKGVVYNPYTNELFTAERGQGAYLNGGKIQVSHKESLKDSILCCDWETADDKHMDQGIAYLKQIALASRVMLVNFSPALDLCNVARGNAEAFVSNGTHIEDHAAGSLILEEAGGNVSSFGLNSWNMESLGIVGTNSHIDMQLSNLLGAFEPL